MLLESKLFHIDPQQQQRLRDIAQRLMAIIDQWKSKQAQRMSQQDISADELMHQLKRYIRTQRGQKLLIGKIRALDNQLKHERTYNVLLSPDENVGGYFDDEYSVNDMLEIKQTAKKHGEQYASRRFRVGLETVRRATRIPTHIIKGVPARYMGRGEIVITLDSIRKESSLPQILSIITHEFTHAVQQTKQFSSQYWKVVEKINRNQEITPEENVIYYTEPSEFEAQLTGLIANIQARYHEISDPASVTSTMTEVEIYRATGLLDEDGVKEILKRNKNAYINMLTDRILNADVETYVYIHEHRADITKELDAHAALCKTNKFKHQDSCKEYSKLKRKYYFADHPFGEFICAVATSPELWHELKTAVNHCISNFS